MRGPLGATLALLVLAAFARAAEPEEEFLTCLADEALAHRAAELGRSRPAAFLALLDAHRDKLSSATAGLLIEADLHLALDRKDAALALYREAAGAFADRPGVYPVDVESPGSALPFQHGPGSHRDHWLVRRFLALGALDDAGREFDRLHEWHRAEVGPAGFTGRGLQFAIDHAYFLRRRGEEERARAVLLEPLLLIDMDRRPPTGSRSRFRGGVSRKEFIRLVWGEFVGAGAEAEVLGAIEAKIEAGQVGLNRLKARIHLHRGEPDLALASEVAYLEARDFSELTLALRRAELLDGLGRAGEAARDYERALALPFSPPDRPDADEEEQEGRELASWYTPEEDLLTSETGFRVHVLSRLERLYAGLGRTDEALDTVLARLGARPDRLGEREVEQVAARFRAAGRFEDFATWARAQAPSVPDLPTRAEIYRRAGDLDAAIRTLGEHAANGGGLSRDLREAYREAGVYPSLLRALVDGNPADALSRLDLLRLDGRLGGEEEREVLEAVLAGTARYPYDDRVPGAWRSPFHVAYRVLRLREREGDAAGVLDLGLRIARGEAPFPYPDEHALESYRHQSEPGLLEDAHACLAVAVALAPDRAAFAALAEALAGSPWEGARAQAERRLAGGLADLAPGSDVGWAHLPPGVRLVASGDCVHALATDESHVYAGHPWGVAVYDHAGTPVSRIALGDAALHLAAGDGAVWAGTPSGLFRIARDGWVVERVAPVGAVTALAPDAGTIWVGERRGRNCLLTRLAVAEGELRSFTAAEMALPRDDDHLVWILPEKGRVFLDLKDAGLLRFDRANEAFDRARYEDRAVHPIGIAGGDLFGHVRLPDPMRDRPCLIDRNTLEVMPLPVVPTPEHGIPCHNGPFSLYGLLDGKVVLGDGGPGYVYEPETRSIRPIDREVEGWQEGLVTSIPAGLLRALARARADGVLTAQDSWSHRHRLGGSRFPARGWSLVFLPDGTGFLGGLPPSATDHERPQGDLRRMNPWADVLHEARDGAGGLWILPTDGPPRRVSPVAAGDSLPADEVLGIHPRPGTDQVWLRTWRGLSALDAEGRVLASFSRRSGLPGNALHAGVWLAGKLWLAAGWGDGAGGLVVLDPVTGVFTSWHEADGLGSDKLADLEVVDGRLRIVHGYLYHRGGRFPNRLRRHPPALFDPATGTVTPGERPAAPATGNPEADAWNRAERPPCPWLGGVLVEEVRIGDRRLLAGSRGLVILEAGAPEVPPVPDYGARIVRSRVQAFLDEARTRKVVIRSREDLAAALADENPWFRAKAIREVGGDELREACADLVASQIDDPCTDLRRAAFELLRRAANDEVVVPALRPLLADPDRELRYRAAVQLATRGDVPPAESIREMLARDPETAHGALADHLDADVLALLLGKPISDHYEEILEREGARVAARAGSAVPVLLRAYGPDQVRYASAVLGYAGEAVLPILHEALASDDRIVRSNAARGCGRIGDSSSNPRLLAALDLESGLSRASIVVALGELGAAEALPRITELHMDAKRDERRRRAGAGFRFTQSVARIGAAYERIEDLESLGAEWDELDAATRPTPVDPLGPNEELLSPDLIVTAVRGIDEGAAREFYLRLASDEDFRARREAAVRLVAGARAEPERFRPALESLLTDVGRDVRVEAAVSLLILGDPRMEEVILGWLESRVPGEKYVTIRALPRVTDRAQLDFARDRLREISEDRRVMKDWRDRARRLLD